MKKASDLRIPFVWEERRPVLLDRFLYVPDHYDRHEDWTPVPWDDPAIFGNDRPIALEFCSGNGQWICEKAKQDPGRNWVALDLRFDRSRKTWTRMHRENIPNLYVICGEARALARHYIPKKSVDAMFVNFPDPWPKLRHAKHRLIQVPFLAEMAAIGKEEAKATFVTDDPTYAAQMLSELAACQLWRPLLKEPRYVLDPADYGSSYFYELWKKKGKQIYYIPYSL